MNFADYVKLITEDNKYPRYIKIEVTESIDKLFPEKDSDLQMFKMKTMSGKMFSDFTEKVYKLAKSHNEKVFEDVNSATGWNADTERTTTDKDIKAGNFKFVVYATVKNEKTENKLLDYARKNFSKFEVTDNTEF